MTANRREESERREKRGFMNFLLTSGRPTTRQRNVLVSGPVGRNYRCGASLCKERHTDPERAAGEQLCGRVMGPGGEGGSVE